MAGLSSYALAYLTQCTFITRKKRRILRDRFDSLADMCSSISQIMKALMIDQDYYETFKRVLDSYDESAFRQYLEDEQLVLVDQRDTEFPELLQEIADVPLLLFAKGNLNLLSQNCVSVVGTRKPSNYGRSAAEIIISDISEAVFVSGGAYGIDQLVHESAVRQGKSTIVVLGMGIERMQSNIACNKLLWKNKGKVLYISEYWPTTRAIRYTFPERNRIISGLSKATIVVEAPRKSGSLITAQCALDQNREVISVPGPIFQEQSTGTNKLLHEGAIPYSKEIMEQLYPSQEAMSEEEIVVLEVLSKPKYSEELQGKNIVLTLSRLEIAGLIHRLSDGRWKRIQY